MDMSFVNQNKRLMQLKFIANIFDVSLKEIKDTLGYETLTMIFRRVGETTAESILKRLEGKYTDEKEFLEKLLETYFWPIIGKENAKFTVEGNEITIELLNCPYKKAGFPIKDMSFFCDYTQGLLDVAIKKAFPNKNFEFNIPSELISKEGCNRCFFKIAES